MLLASMADRNDRHRDGNLAEGHFGVVDLTQEIADEVDSSRACAHPAWGLLERVGVFGVFPGSDGDFAKIIHARPNEVAD